MSVIVYGPPGCGKTRNAEKLRLHFGMDEVVEAEFDPYPLSPKQVEEFKTGKILFLTNLGPKVNGYHEHSRRVISFEAAMKEASK